MPTDFRRPVVPGLLRIVGLAAFAISVTVLLISFLLFVPLWQLTPFKSQLNAKDYLSLVNSYRTTWAQVIAGAGLLIGLYFTWLRLAATERTIEISQEGQITERFTRAIEHLGSDKREIRLDGIYALERIARDSVRDHWQIMEIFTTYVRQNAHWDWAAAPRQASAVDVQAVLTVVGRRSRSYGRGEEGRLAFGETDLRRYDFKGANFDGANFDLAHLEWAHFENASLSETSFLAAWLDHANLTKSRLARASLKYARLNNAILDGADLSQANLFHVRASGAGFGAADLSGATLLGAQLIDADLQGQTWPVPISSASISILLTFLTRTWLGRILGPQT